MTDQEDPIVLDSIILICNCGWAGPFYEAEKVRGIVVIRHYCPDCQRLLATTEICTQERSDEIDWRTEATRLKQENASLQKKNKQLRDSITWD